MKKLKRGPEPIARVIYTAQILPVDDPLRAKVVSRLKAEIASAGKDVTELSKRWNVSKRQVQRTIAPYRESGEIVEKETVGEKISRALARRAKESDS